MTAPAAPPAPPGRPQALVSSAIRLQYDGDPNARIAREIKRAGLPWQQRAFAYYELLGEIWYAAQFYARALQKIELKLVRRVGPNDWEDVEDSELLEYVERVQDPGGGRANLMGAYGRLKFLAGECYLLVTQDDVPDGEDEGDPGEVWEMLSCDELRWHAQERVYKRYRIPNTQPETLEETPEGVWEPLPDTAIAYRFWTRHPQYSGLADGPMRGVLDLCEELVILTRAVRARGRSRLAGSGLLLIPDEVDYTTLTGTTPSEDPNQDPFIARLTEAMVAGIVDEGTAAAVVPLVLKVGAEWIEKFRHLQIINPEQTYPETGLRMECIQRIAIGLDMPPEILLGKADANHWSAWQIDEDSFTAHLQPVVQGFCDDFTGGYLRPSMRAGGVADWRDYAITYDATAVIVHPDRMTDAKELHDRLVISDESLRDAGGFDDDDVPDDAEYRRRVGLKLNVPELAVDGELPDPPPAPVIAPPMPEPDEDAEPQEDAPTAPPGDEEGEEPEAEVAGAELLQFASGMICDRAREAAGAKLRTRYAKDRRLTAALDGVPNREVPARMGLLFPPADLEPLLAERHNLVCGAAEVFRTRLLEWGLSPEDAEMIIALGEQRAAETLFDASPA